MREEECQKAIRELALRLDEIEVLLNSLLEEIRELRGGRRAYEKSSLLDAIRRNKFLYVHEVKSRNSLRKLVERGLALVLRDEGANQEIVTTRDIVKSVLDRLPMSISDVEKLDEREYELLKFLNRLGYVIVKDGQYKPTPLAEEFL